MPLLGELDPTITATEVFNSAKATKACFTNMLLFMTAWALDKFGKEVLGGVFYGLY